MNKITEIIPDDIPQWAKEAIDNGNFFKVAIERGENKLATTHAVALNDLLSCAEWHEDQADIYECSIGMLGGGECGTVKANMDRHRKWCKVLRSILEAI